MADKRENIGVDFARDTDQDWLIPILVEVGHFRSEDVDNVTSTGKC